MQTEQLNHKATRGRYVKGCRCEGCVVANREYQKQYLRNRRKANLVDVHGRRYDRCT